MRAAAGTSKVARLRGLVKRGEVVVVADAAALDRARRRGKLTIDARDVAERLIDALPDLFGAEDEVRR